MPDDSTPSPPTNDPLVFASASRRTWSAGQAAFYILLIVALVWCVWTHPHTAPLWGGVLALVGYALVVCVRTVAVLAGLVLHDLESGDADRDDENGASWPVYTVLLPVYREAGMLPGMVEALAALDYPRDRLDAILLVESDDAETLAAAERLAPAWLRVLVVPDGSPRTKPRACNAGLEQARGEFLVVFDAEDRPEPDQLKRAVRTFRRLPPAVACLQARLNYYNSRHNLLTRCFALEYAAWFDLYLPGLHSLGGVIPLGGTSNHFRTDTLRALHGWDPWNVTEDCELGVRLSRARLETRILDSTTWEEAVSRFGPWLRQRSRWTKGYWQTHLVHTRRPLDTLMRLGLWRTLLMVLTVGGQVAVLLANPVSWVLAALWLWHPWPLHDPAHPLSRALLVGTVALALANVLFVAIHALAAARRRRLDLLLPACLLMPCYWCLVSIGAWRGVLQSFVDPFRWEKTPHGLGAGASAAGGADIAPRGGDPTPDGVSMPCGSATPWRESVGPAALAGATIPRTATRRHAAHRHSWWRWGSVAAVLATLLAIAVVAAPLARWLMIVFGAVPLSGASAEDERDVEACWIGQREAVLTLSVTPGDWTSPGGLPLKTMPLVAVVHAKVGDGEYFETRIRGIACPLSGDATNLIVNVPLGKGWRSRAPGAVWGPWSVRRVRAVGLRLYGADGPPRSVRIAAVAARGDIPAPALAARIGAAPQVGEVWRRWEADFALSREYANPFDPGEIDAWGVFTSPTGAVVRVPAFYTCDYVRPGTGAVERLILAGAPHWAVRFLPPDSGTWHWRLELSDHTGAHAVTPDAPLAVAPATTAGPVRVEPGQPWFRHANGAFFYPIALNIRSPSDTFTDTPDWPLYSPGAPDPEGGAAAMEGYLRRMGAAGITLGRVWTSPWFGGLEWTAKWNGYHGLGRYNLQNAWRIDRVLETAEARGVTVELALQSHGPFTWNYDVQWDDNPYNRANGGPLDDPSAVLTDPEAKRWMFNRLRYGAARWGASPALFGWLLWIEVNTVNHDDAAILSWHREAEKVLHRFDVGGHLVTTEFQGPNLCPDIWQQPGMDYIQCPAYNFGHGLIGSFDETLDALSSVGKPLYIEEYGGTFQGGDPRWVTQEIHDGLWAGRMKPFAGSPMAWWWNFIFARQIDRHYARFAAFVQGQDLRGRDWRYPALAITNAPRLTLLARASDDLAEVYVYGPSTEVRYGGGGWQRASRTWRRLAGDFNPLAADPGRQFDVPAGTLIDLGALRLRDGNYAAEVWDTWSTNAPVRSRIAIHAGSGTLSLPALTRDAAIRIR